jgi:glycerol uptake facilitator-like aquaporin
MKKYIAELFGTFTLTTIVLLSLGSTAVIVTPFAAALTLMLFVYTIGPISGSHINPAVTLGLMSIKKISVKEGFMYILYQIIGAAFSLFVLSFVFSTFPNIVVSSSFSIWLAEILGALFFTFGIASVVYGKVADAASGVVVGGSLLLGILAASYLGSNGVLNPAVSFGIGSFGLAYVFGPIIGSVAGFNLYKWLSR